MTFSQVYDLIAGINYKRVSVAGVELLRQLENLPVVLVLPPWLLELSSSIDPMLELDPRGVQFFRQRKQKAIVSLPLCVKKK